MRLTHLLLLLPLVTACATAPDATTPAPPPPVARDNVERGTGCPEPSSAAATGRIGGSPFVVEASSIKEGILELRQGDDFIADRGLTLFLFLDEGEVPVGRSFDFDEDSGFGSPHVHMNWRGERDSGFESEVFMNDYRMRLAFHDEQDGVLSGTIHLCLPDDGGSWVSGSFNAAIEGFRLINGKPDLSQDGMKNFDYLAVDYLQADLGTTVEIESTERKRFTHPGPSGPQVGSADVLFVADGVRQTRRFLFVKLDDLWRVDKVLEMNRLAEAHPYTEPGEAPSVHDQLAWVVAREIEQRVHAQHPGTAIYPGNGYSVVESYSAGDTSADVRASYRVGDSEEKIVLQFTLGRQDDRWQVENAGDLTLQQAGLGGN